MCRRVLLLLVLVVAPCCWAAAAASTGAPPHTMAFVTTAMPLTSSKSTTTTTRRFWMRGACGTGATPCLFAGFGGFSSQDEKATTRPTKKQKKKKQKKKKISSLVVENDETSTAPFPQQQEPQLDRFGLPVVPTLDELFPPPTRPIEAGATTPTSQLSEIVHALDDYLPLNFSLFDEESVEKNSRQAPMKLTLLHQSPPVLTISNFFSSAECRDYQNLMETTSSSSTTTSNDFYQVSSALFAADSTYTKRTSTSWFCSYRSVPVLLAKMQRLFGLDSVQSLEEPQLVRYRTGQEFSWHYDQVPASQLANGGQRVATFLLYLNTLTLSEGGATVFRDLYFLDNDEKLAVTPQEGTALLFFPANRQGEVDDRTLHKGQVIMGLEKKIAQVWIHEHESYQPSVPPGNSNSDDALQQAIRHAQVQLGHVDDEEKEE